jgi:hypothetical protein
MATDWTKIYKKYKGLWVALSADETTVLGFGKTAKEALLKSKLKSKETPFLTRVPKTLTSYAGALLQ